MLRPLTAIEMGHNVVEYLYIPDVRYHLKDDSTGQYVSCDMNGDDGLFLSKSLNDPFVLSLRNIESSTLWINDVANCWGKPCTVVVSIDWVVANST